MNGEHMSGEHMFTPIIRTGDATDGASFAGRHGNKPPTGLYLFAKYTKTTLSYRAAHDQIAFTTFIITPLLR